MSESIERDGVFGKYTEHYDDAGNKIGESREREGVFGNYVEHTNAEGTKIGESREREGFFGAYTEHTGASGGKVGESREREGVFGDYTEHTNKSGSKIGESRQREGVFGPYVEHTGPAWSGSGRETYASPGSSSGDGWWVGPLIGLMVAIGVIVAVIWLAVFIVLPVVLLNSALGLTILGVIYKNRRTLFAALSFIGGGYLLIDILQGWLSALFVQNVVGNPVWITAVVYVNAAAIAVSTWFLVQPIWANSQQVKETDRNRSIMLMGGSIALVAAAMAAIPLIYHLVPNRLGMNSGNSVSAGTPGERSGTSTTGLSRGPNGQPSSNFDRSLTTAFDRNYDGTIGNQSFSLSLVRDGDRLTGQASTTRSTDTLSGTINAGGQFELKGLENGERYTGIYKGAIFGNGTIQGAWTKPDGSRETTFSVSQTP